MARTTIEDCLDNVDNRFQLVLIASKRARQISMGADPLVPIDNDKPTVIALREIAQGLVDALTLTKAGPGVDLKDAVTFSWKSRNYVASRRNTMAQAMAKRALYTPETMVMVEALNNLSYRVRNTISLFNDTVSNTEAEILAIGNKETLELFNETTGFARMFLIRKRFKSTTDENGVKCYRLEVED